MELSKKTFALTILIAVLISSFATAYALNPRLFIWQEKKATKARANVYVFKETPEGTALILSGNVLTDIGENYFRNVMGFNNVTNFNATQWISLGNCTVGQTKTKLDTEATTAGFTRAGNDSAVAWVNSGDFATNHTKKFTATATIYVNATGLQWSGVSNSDNNMAACASLGGFEKFENNWNCTITWVITWNAN